MAGISHLFLLPVTNICRILILIATKTSTLCWALLMCFTYRFINPPATTEGDSIINFIRQVRNETFRKGSSFTVTQVERNRDETCTPWAWTCTTSSHAGVLSCFSHVRFFATPWTLACQVPLSMGFSRQGYWSGGPCPPAGDLPDPGIEPGSFIFLMSAGGFFTSEPPRKLLQRGLMGQNPGALNAVTKDQVLHWLWFPDGDTSHSYPQWVVWESKKWKQKSFKF